MGEQDSPGLLTKLLAGYAAADDRYDELLAAPGEPRPHWDAFVRSLAARGEREVSDTLSLTERQIQIGRASCRERV